MKKKGDFVHGMVVDARWATSNAKICRFSREYSGKGYNNTIIINSTHKECLANSGISNFPKA